MFWLVIPLILSPLLAAAQGQHSSTCKDPAIARRLLADDVRYASPFYVIALPRTPETEKMDNVCYTYFETDLGPFNHIISVTYKDGINKYHRYTKGDIKGSLGLAEAIAIGSSCTFHDHTLIPICNSTVFILYRCFKSGSCRNIDIGQNPGVDARITLAATTKLSEECYRELRMNLNDTSSLDGGDYIILPYRQQPQCIKKYDNKQCIGYNRTVGTGNREVDREDAPQERFGDDRRVSEKIPQQSVTPTAKPTHSTQPKPHAPVNSLHQNATVPSLHPSSPHLSTSTSKPFTTNGFPSNSQWSRGPSPWTGQPARPTDETHYHWQGQPGAALPPNAKVYYHVHRWDSLPPGCTCNWDMKRNG